MDLRYRWILLHCMVCTCTRFINRWSIRFSNCSLGHYDYWYSSARYWVLVTAQNWLSSAEALTDTRNNDGLAVAAGIFAFLAGLGLVAIIVLVILEFLFKAKFLRFISFIIMLAVIVLGFIAGLLTAIYFGNRNAFWPTGMNLIIEWMILPIIICFGYLYFFGAPAKNKK